MRLDAYDTATPRTDGFMTTCLIEFGNNGEINETQIPMTVLFVCQPTGSAAEEAFPT